MIKIDFEQDTSYGTFRDALYLPEDNTFTPEEIDAMKQERVNNWIAIVSAPPVEVPVEPPVEFSVEPPVDPGA